MFAKATRNFVRETDSGGDLIPVSHLNASDKLQLLSLVTKRKKFWCWQKPKYHFLAVSLSDVLTEDKPIKPVIVESDFAKYMGKFEDVVQGSIETSFGKISLGAGAKGCVESQSSFGNLRKQEVDLQQLMKDVKDRMINLNSSLLQQVIERKREVLCILREKIITTQRCTISEHIQTEEKVSGLLGCSTKIVQVSVSDSGSMMKDSSVILEIPPATTIAYGVIELFIKCDGQFEFCLLDEQQGGFERESSEGSTSPHSVLFRDTSFLYHPDAVDNGMHSGAESPIPSHASLSVLKEGLSQLKAQFQPFVKLPEDKQRALYKSLCELLLHEETLTALEDVLDALCAGDKPDLKELKPAQQQDLADFLQLVGCSVQDELLLQNYQLQDEELLSAVHLLISAISELSDYTLVLLRACSDLQVVPALCCLPYIASADGTLALSSPLVATLTDTGRFDVVQRLFASTNINLEKTESSVKAVTMREPRFFPLVLYVALCGLHSLSGAVEELF
ncbi:gasdermin-E isoform X1 [Tympanuchus pallidicinctus]|uniref:gasdermin-E isoform X1 n=1 Tax=Tympanuchus pallidicinctus TaxID=109042 RepID=UPI0022874F20|nr:gasdermin-E isoform X1 [Tympanuchus pallidicinctus]XP_052549517.1 gasdermin-E isoform X1 [Tympanuchus pallidicinctus]XP_052549518.1 gasdermin-E isoform X1 [Tympanuchus pallidicinctus]XP_052549519.1 gasdermin-E isoform X1 [Tympanuchus pallidicinctus]XP_052549520.1 gasdermin-E isoform X1 [Tympanuchus pallidicinctus]XP_052549522.1 gasdermin-E isoform X1 [Tympanuchus pallidicinctus]